jgi:hypothetical protein
MGLFEKQIKHLERQIKDSRESIGWIKGEGVYSRFSDSSGDITEDIIRKHEEIISNSEYLISAYEKLASGGE